MHKNHLMVSGTIELGLCAMFIYDQYPTVVHVEMQIYNPIHISMKKYMFNLYAKQPRWNTVQMRSTTAPDCEIVEFVSDISLITVASCFYFILCCL